VDWLTERPIAHRGLHAPGVPENTLPAAEAAVEAGYPVECDVRLTEDGVPVVCHDERLHRLTGRDGTVSGTLWPQLRGLTVGDSDEPIPRLRSLLRVVDGRVPILAELKCRGLPGRLEAAVADAFDTYDGAFAVQSFNPLSVLWFRRHRPGWARGLLGGRPRSVTPPERLVTTHLLGRRLCAPHFLAYQHEHLPARALTRAPAALPVLAWTVRSETGRRRALRHADNVIFEDIRPSPARGQWRGS